MANFDYDVSRLNPVINELVFSNHIGIYKKFTENFNKGVGDIPFNKAGAFLHKLYFENLREHRQQNLPLGKVAEIIMMRYGNWDNFVSTYSDTVAKLQGSGWVFMNTSGYLNIIPNNRIVDNIAMIIDFWEHAYYLQYQNLRPKYIGAFWNVVDWNAAEANYKNAKAMIIKTQIAESVKQTISLTE